MIRLLISFLGVVFLLTGHSGEARTPVTKEVTSWLRAKADTFGCFLEGRLGFRDPKFNCNLKNYRNKATPCDEGAKYEEGPAFPEDKAAQVNPAIRHLTLAWEHGELQAVQIELDKEYPQLAIEKMLKLPKAGKYPDNVFRIQFISCVNKVSCVLIEGFEHQGAGDTECRIPDSKAPPKDPTEK